MAQHAARDPHCAHRSMALSARHAPAYLPAYPALLFKPLVRAAAISYF
ncbi:hypothetical protein [Xanthomonas hortorum]|uniref:Uncharacterized protein n=1 Tax=Xanthomonas hortorum TaxID=56454 RepID=A0AA47ETU7_9XANT|nr:hypothetical protein [Xanthomonas hortorum]WAH65124.1 hypothetical protein OEG85_03835 [Xanthomonas hortorum]